MTAKPKTDPNAKAPLCKICDNKHFGVKHIWTKKKRAKK